MSLLRKASIVTTPTSYENGKILSVKPVQSFGSELVSQPNFQSQGSWFVFNNNQGTIGGGTATIIGDGSNAFAQWRHNFSVSTSKKYELIVTISETNNNIEIAAASGVTDFPNKDNAQTGTHTFRFTPTAPNFVLKIGINNNPNGNATLTFVSLKEVIDADFDFTRNSSATRTNSQGLIEDITSNLPRIDYTGGVGHWLFEPQSTNTATYSNDFTQGDIFVTSADPSVQEVVLTSQQSTSPDGTNNAWKLVDNNDGLTGQAALNYYATTVIANNYNTISYFVKKQGSNNFVYISINGFDAGANGNTWFNIQNGTLGNVSANHTANIQNYGNGWYRISITMQATTDVVGSFSLILANSNGSGVILRDGTNGVYFFGVQAESDASRQFMTSYIPTNGEVNGVTRLADAAFGAGSSDLINSTEGVLYAEIAALADDNIARNISLGSGDLTNTVEIFYGNSTNQISFKIRANNSNVTVQNRTVSDRTQFAKVAIKYKSGEIKGFINGVKEVDRTDSFTFSSSLSKLTFERANGSDEFEGKVKCVAVFKEALTDAELTCLTTI